MVAPQLVMVAMNSAGPSVSTRRRFSPRLRIAKSWDWTRARIRNAVSSMGLAGEGAKWREKVMPAKQIFPLMLLTVLPALLAIACAIPLITHRGIVLAIHGLRGIAKFAPCESLRPVGLMDHAEVEELGV